VLIYHGKIGISSIGNSTAGYILMVFGKNWISPSIYTSLWQVSMLGL
jgi:hypothetical protein